MVVFSELPLELLPLVIQHFVQPAHISQLCLVNKDFYSFTIGQLYRRIFIYAWHKNAKGKVVKLFQTLAHSLDLARYVEELTIRDFPKALLLGERTEVLQVCVQGLQNCVNLRACTWTRNGSLSTDVLQALSQLPVFSDLEINGKNERQYNPETLIRFNRLRKICLIMPGNPVIEILPRWLDQTGVTLRHLNLICKSSPRVNDGFLGVVAPHLTNLEHLHLLGCPKVTHDGLWEVVSRNNLGLISLGMEALSPAFDMADFSQRCERFEALRRLRSITLTVSQHTDLRTWTNHVLNLLSSSPLEMFHISGAAGGDVVRGLTDDFVELLASVHGQHLRRFSVQRMPVSIAAIEDICRRCVNLEQLFVVVEFDQVDDLGRCLALTRNLRSLHINRPIESSSDDIPVIPMDKILSLLKQSGSELTQIGFSTRVWQVEHDVYTSKEGEIEVELKLAPYEHPELPEQFLVRT